MMRHLASLRSICETLPGVGGVCKPAMCTCGKEVADPVHFSTSAYQELSEQGHLVQSWGMTVDRRDLPPGRGIDAPELSESQKRFQRMRGRR